MNLVDKADLKVANNCLLIFGNKKLHNFEGANEIVASFSGIGYYFDKIAFIAYDKSDEIVRAVKDGKENYENIVIYCPAIMEKTLKNFLTNLYNAKFNELGVIGSEKYNAFILFSDKENRLRFDDIKQILDAKYGVKYEKAYVKTIGASAKEINSAINKAINIDPSKAEKLRKLIDFNVSGNYGDCLIEIVYSEEISKSAFDKVFRSLVSSLDEYVYCIEDYTLAERLYQLLKLRRMKISVAESFTGGGIGKKLVEIPGISEVYFEGLNTYSNEAKMQRLGVRNMTLHQFGAVSRQTAGEMAEGLIKSGNCDISIATTGIAGPKSDNTSKPVGLVYIAVGTRKDVSVFKYNLKGDRNTITNTAVNLALFHAFKTLK